MRRFHLSALIGFAGCVSVPAEPQTTPTPCQIPQVAQEQPIVITSGITLIRSMQESPASWAALQDLYSQLRSFEAAYRAACSAPELCGRIDPRAQRQYEDLTELRDVVHHRLLRVWIAHPEGSDRVDTRVTLEWEAAAQRRYPFTISPRLADDLRPARGRAFEVLDDYYS